MKILSLGVLTISAALMAQPGITAEPAVETVTAAPVKLDTEAVAAAVTQALRIERDLNSKNISVTTHAGTIVLSGTVATEPEAARALSVAEKAANGIRVSSGIEVVPPAAGTPEAASAQLVRDVEAALRKDPRTANLGITVNGDAQKSIQLHGLVPSAKDRTAAQAVASSVKGVANVENKLLTP